MPKVNVNAATREELIDVAGLRPELAEAIIKLRDERGRIGSIDELDAVQGVGPATLERLRETLSFGVTAEEKTERERVRAEEKVAQEKEQLAREKAEEKAAAEREHVKAEQKAERDRVKAAQDEERVVRETAEKTAEAGRAALKASAEAASKIVRGGLELVQKRTGATVETQRETVRISAEGTAEFSKLFMDVVGEQTRHSLQVAEAFGRVFNWAEIARLQSEFVRGSIERMNQLNGRYLEIVQGVMTTATDAAKEQAKKAA